jgi:GTPase SAR1 family protein
MVEKLLDQSMPSHLTHIRAHSLPLPLSSQQKCRLEDKVIKFEIWDTAGQERFHSE